jgi:hypothetical protein
VRGWNKKINLKKSYKAKKNTTIIIKRLYLKGKKLKNDEIAKKII